VTSTFLARFILPGLRDKPGEGGDLVQRLARIRALWVELKGARNDRAKSDALTRRIREEADAYMEALRRHTPKKKP
jgi:hypothetical protein